MVGLAVGLLVSTPLGASSAQALQSDDITTYDTTVTLVSYSHPVQTQQGRPNDTVRGPLVLEGDCDGAGPCSLLEALPGPGGFRAKLEGSSLEPGGGGRYHVEVVRLRSPTFNCGMHVTVTLDLRFSGGKVTGSYSYVPENGGRMEEGKSTCFEPTERYTLVGTREGGAAGDPAGSGSEGSGSKGSGSNGSAGGAGAGRSSASDAEDGSNLVVKGAVALGVLAVAGAGAVAVRRKRGPSSGHGSPASQSSVRPVHDTGRQTVTLDERPTVRILDTGEADGNA